MKQKEIFLAYINNNRDKLQDDVRQLQQRLRYRNADAIDCLELSLALERLNAFEDFSRSAQAILKLSVPDPVTYVSIDTNESMDDSLNHGRISPKECDVSPITASIIT